MEMAKNHEKWYQPKKTDKMKMADNHKKWYMPQKSEKMKKILKNGISPKNLKE
jgi:hypothetical protein